MWDKVSLCDQWNSKEQGIQSLASKPYKSIIIVFFDESYVPLLMKIVCVTEFCHVYLLIRVEKPICIAT